MGENVTRSGGREPPVGMHRGLTPPAPVRTFLASDGYTFYLRHYPAAGHPRARLVFVHGIRSHGGWYTRSCVEFAAAGFDVHFLDRRGAGLNSARRGDSPPTPTMPANAPPLRFLNQQVLQASTVFSDDVGPRALDPSTLDNPRIVDDMRHGYD